MLTRSGLAGLDDFDVFGLEAAVGLLRRELDLLALLEGAEAVALDVLVVDEQLVATIVGRNESPTLLGVEELHGAGRHAGTPFDTWVSAARRCDCLALPTA